MKRLFLFFLAVFCSGAVFSLSLVEGAAGRDIILDIEVSGLRRTKPFVVQGKLEKYLGLDADSVNIDEVKAIIIDTGILDPVSVEIRDGEVAGYKVLAVEVREKWALFPIPLLIATSGNLTVGGAFFDANAFGLNDKAAIAGVFSRDGWMATLLYMHEGRGRLPGWNLAGAMAHSDAEDTDQKDRVLRSYEKDTYTASAGFIFHLNETITPQVRFTLTRDIITNSSDTGGVPEGSVIYAGIQPEVQARTSNWDGYLLSEQRAAARYSLYLGDEEPLSTLGFSAHYERPFVPGFRLSLKTGLIWSPRETPVTAASPSEANVDILPASFSAPAFAGFSAGVEKALWSPSWGTLSFLAAYQAVYSSGLLLGGEFDHGAFAALRFYLRRLAIPALGIGLSYNAAKDYWQGSFSIGAGF